MKVLHIWNTAGVASIIAKFQKKLLGWDTWVVTRKKYDPYGLTIYGEALNVSKYFFYIRTIALASSYDIIHVHDLDKIVPIIRKIFPRKKIVLHYHGQSIRNKWMEKSRYWRKADVVIVATKDLLADAPIDAKYVPNPVDTDIFRPMSSIKRIRGTALFMFDNKSKFISSLEWARKLSEKHGLKLHIHNRAEKPIRYLDLPRFLNSFEYYIDHNWVAALSKTALEALACGVKVFRWDSKLIDKLPVHHRPEHVVFRLAEIYSEV